MFVFYFEDSTELEMVLKKALCSFDSYPMLIQKLDPGVSPSSLLFNFTLIWIHQVHDFPLG